MARGWLLPDLARGLRPSRHSRWRRAPGLRGLEQLGRRAPSGRRVLHALLRLARRLARLRPRRGPRRLALLARLAGLLAALRLHDQRRWQHDDRQRGALARRLDVGAGPAHHVPEGQVTSAMLAYQARRARPGTRRLPLIPDSLRHLGLFARLIAWFPI